MAGIVAQTKVTGTKIDDVKTVEFNLTEIRTKLCQSWIEVQNGLNMDRLFIKFKDETDAKFTQIQGVVDSLYKKSGFVL